MRGIHLGFAVVLALSASVGARDAFSGGPELRESSMTAPGFADLVVVDKSDRRLTLYARGKAIGQYRVALGDVPEGHKRASGDERTPEGLYAIDRRNPRSDFYLSVGISYPNASDIAQAAAAGLDPGGDIFIHGQPNGYPGHIAEDWTDGCIAVSNREIYEIWHRVPTGTPVAIQP